MGVHARVGPYQPLEILGRGGMGVVYVAEQHGLSRRVALKLISEPYVEDPAFRARFIREARAAARVEHPNVVPIYDAGECDGHLYIAMRLIEGRSLAAISRDDGPIPSARACRLLTQVALALDAAHRRGVIHRDVKPANILVAAGEYGEEAFLTDFGLARPVEAGATVTDDGHWVGTVDYAAPEQLTGGAAEARADVYALGCVLHRTITGRLPHAGDDVRQRITAKLTQPPRLDPGLEEDPIAAVIERALSRDPADRYPTAREMAAAMLAAEGSDEASTMSAIAAEVALGKPATSAPNPIDQLFGRADELSELIDRAHASRVVTILGPGGVGKTRLAVELGARATGRFATRPHFVSLAAVSGASRIPSAIAASLAVPVIAGESANAAVLRYLEPRAVLLILDNFEHLVDGAPFVTEIVARCPSVRIVATSREPLRVRGEKVFHLAPLSTSDAVALFLDRAEGYVDKSALEEADIDRIRSICERLDCLPLALELAAPRLQILSPHQLLEHLGKALPMLVGGTRDAPARHRTMHATIDWSHRLLSDAESEALARFAVFAGGCSLPAATHVTGAGLSTLESLVAKHLVVRRGDRLWMLQTIREFAMQQLLERTDADEVRERHAGWYEGLAREGAKHVFGAQRRRWLSTLDREAANLRDAITWALARRDGARALELVSAFGPYWIYGHRGDEGLDHTQRALACAGTGTAAGLRADALFHRALLWNQPDLDERYEHRLPDLEQAIELYDAAGDDRGVALGHAWISVTLFRLGREEDALCHGDKVMTAATRLGDRELELIARRPSVWTAPWPVQADLARDTARAFSELGNLHEATWLLAVTAYVALSHEDDATALALLEQSLRDATELGNEMVLLGVSENRGFALLFLGRPSDAAASFRESLSIARDAALTAEAGETLLGLAAVASSSHDHERAARLAGAVAERIQIPDHPVTRAIHERLHDRFLRPARAEMGEAGWQEAFSAGQRLTREQAVDLGLDVGSA